MTARLLGVLSAALLTLAPSLGSGQPVDETGDALLDVLVFGTHMRINTDAYAGPLRAALERYLKRANGYESPRPAPSSGEGRMVHAAQVNYERRLAAISEERNAIALAVEYVEQLRPCYEWEGLHDCPEREAVFADTYRTARPDGPFSAYLVLLAAHRWLCTAEAYEYEMRPADATRSRERYEQRLAAALGSTGLLLREAAKRLAARKRCFATR